ncbi:MAG: hypothetical protein AAF329_22660, partial [Cyanobacteria bacterium P01_A01_bin.17]
MQNLDQNQLLWKRSAVAPSSLLWIVVLSCGAVLSPLLQSQAFANDLDAVLGIDVSEIEAEEQVFSADAPLSPELNLPPLEQSLITIDPQGPEHGSAATSSFTLLDESPQSAVGTPQTSSAPEITGPDPVVSTTEKSTAEDLKTQQNHLGNSFGLFSQMTPALEGETVDPGDSIDPGDSTLEASPDAEKAPDAEEAADAEESSEEREYVFGRNGQGRWFIQAGIGIPYNPDESNFYGLAGAGITHFFASGHSINVSLNTLAFSQEGSDSIGINLDVIARWHFLRKKTWSLFVDGGVGILNTTSRAENLQIEETQFQKLSKIIDYYAENTLAKNHINALAIGIYSEG